MEFLMKRVIMFAVVPAILVGLAFIGLNSVDAQNMTPGNMMAGNMTPGNMMAGNMTPGNMMAGNMTPGNMMAGNMTPGNMMTGSVKTHLEEGIKALEAGNNQVANTHLDFAKQAMANAPSEAVKHFEEGMKALNAGDSKGAIMHLKFADQALG
jgi:hypothetical protein